MDESITGTNGLVTGIEGSVTGSDRIEFVIHFTRSFEWANFKLEINSFLKFKIM